MWYISRMAKPIYISLIFFLLSSIPAVLIAHHGFRIYLAGILVFFGIYIAIQAQRCKIVTTAILLQIAYVTASSILMIYHHVGTGISRPQGLFANVNFTAQMLELSLPVLVALAFSKSIKGIPKWLLYGGIAINLLALLITQTRGAWISAVIALGILLFFVKGWRGILAGVTTVGVFACIQYNTIAGRISTMSSASNGQNIERLNGWLVTPKMIMDFPLGMGFNNFKYYYPAYMLPDAKELLIHPHNLFLGIAADAGILAAISFSCFVGFLAWYIVKNIRYIPDTFYYMFALGCAAALLTVVLHGMVDYTLKNQSIMVFCMLEAGFCVGMIDYYKFSALNWK